VANPRVKAQKLGYKGPKITGKERAVRASYMVANDESPTKAAINYEEDTGHALSKTTMRSNYEYLQKNDPELLETIQTQHMGVMLQRTKEIYDKTADRLNEALDDDARCKKASIRDLHIAHAVSIDKFKLLSDSIRDRGLVGGNKIESWEERFGNLKKTRDLLLELRELLPSQPDIRPAFEAIRTAPVESELADSPTGEQVGENEMGGRGDSGVDVRDASRPPGSTEIPATSGSDSEPGFKLGGGSSTESAKGSVCGEAKL